MAEEQGGKGIEWADESVLEVISLRKESQEGSGGPQRSGVWENCSCENAG